MGLDGNDCPPHPSILHHMLLHSQQIHILHHTIFPLFPMPSCYLSSPNSYTSPNTPTICPFHMSKPSQSSLPQLLTEMSSTPHIYATSMLDLLSCHLTSAMYLSILWSHLCRTSISLLANSHASVPYSRADLTQASYTLPLVLSPALWFTHKQAISRHLLYAAVTLDRTALSTPASQSSTSPK